MKAEIISVDASKLVTHVQLSLSPSSGTFVEGSTFDVPILINTEGASINGIDIKIDFDQSRLAIFQPSSGVSVIGVWIEPPKYDNTAGTASYVGVAPSGVNIFSETHPFPDNWYNNNSPIVSWDRDPGVVGFSYVLDNNPSTIPGNAVNITDTTKSFEGLADGLWYFHIKASKAGVWGTTGHFLMRIDTTPPADFKPQANYMVAATILVERTLVSFFTTDNLSGIDHYEIGVIDKSQPTTVSPVFVQAESPFQVPITKGSKLQVIVRAIDKAGNVRDSSIDVAVPFVITKFIQDYLVYILIFIILAGFIGLILHYLVGHHIIRYLRRVSKIMKKEEATDKRAEEMAEATPNIPSSLSPLLPPNMPPSPPLIPPSL